MTPERATGRINCERCVAHSGPSYGLGDFQKTLGHVFYRMAFHDTARAATRTLGSMEHFFIIISFGDLLGVPILPPYYTLRLLPYVVPDINNRRRRMLRERDIVDMIGYGKGDS